MWRRQSLLRARRIITFSYDSYDLVTNNCEHFVNISTRNDKVCHQIKGIQRFRIPSGLLSTLDQLVATAAAVTTSIEISCYCFINIQVRSLLFSFVKLSKFLNFHGSGTLSFRVMYVIFQHSENNETVEIKLFCY